MTPEQLEAVHAAMMEELGIGRKETLYLDNGKRLNQPVDLAALEQGKRSKDPYSQEFKITKKHAVENKAWKEAFKHETSVAHLEDQLDEGHAHRKRVLSELTKHHSGGGVTERGGKYSSSGEGLHQTIPKNMHGKETSRPHSGRSDDVRNANVKAATDYLRGMGNLLGKDAPHRQSRRKANGSVSFSSDHQGRQNVIPKPNLSYDDKRSVNDLPIVKNITSRGHGLSPSRPVRQPNSSFSLATPEDFLAAQGMGRSKPIKSPQPPGGSQSGFEMPSAGLGISRSAVTNFSGSVSVTSPATLTSSPTSKVGLASSVFAKKDSAVELSRPSKIGRNSSSISEATKHEIDKQDPIRTKPTLEENQSLRSSQHNIKETRDGITKLLFEGTCKVGTKVHKTDSAKSIGSCVVHLLKVVGEGNTSIILKIMAGDQTVHMKTLERNFSYHIDSAFLVFESLSDEGYLTKWQMMFQFAHFANLLKQMIEDHRTEFAKPTSQLDLTISVPGSGGYVSTRDIHAHSTQSSLGGKDKKDLISFSDPGDDGHASETLLSSYAQDLMSLLDDQAIDRALETLNCDESLLDRISAAVDGISITKSAAEIVGMADNHLPLERQLSEHPETSCRSNRGDTAIGIDLNGGLGASQYAATNQIVSELLRTSSVFRSLPEQITTPYAHRMSQMVLQRAQGSSKFSSQPSECLPLATSSALPIIGNKPNNNNAFISYSIEDLLNLRSQARFVNKKLIRDEYTSAGAPREFLVPNIANSRHRKAASQGKPTSGSQPAVMNNSVTTTGVYTKTLSAGDDPGARPQKRESYTSWLHEFDSTSSSKDINACDAKLMKKNQMQGRTSGLPTTETQYLSPQISKSLSDLAVDMNSTLPDQLTERMAPQELVDSENTNFLAPQHPTGSLITGKGSVNMLKPAAIKSGLSSSQFASHESQDKMTEAAQEETARRKQIAERPAGHKLLPAAATSGIVSSNSNSSDSLTGQFSQGEQVNQPGYHHLEAREKHVADAGIFTTKNPIVEASVATVVASLSFDKSSTLSKEKEEILSVSSPAAPGKSEFQVPGSWQNSIRQRRVSIGSRTSKDSVETVRPLELLVTQVQLKEKQPSAIIHEPSRPSSGRMLRVSMDSTSTAGSFATASEGHSSEEDDKRMVMPPGVSLLPGNIKSQTATDSFASFPKSSPKNTMNTMSILTDREVKSAQPAFGQPWNPSSRPLTMTASAEVPNLKGGLMSSRFASAQNKALYQVTKLIENSPGDISSGHHGIATIKPIASPNALANEFFPASGAGSQIPSAKYTSLPKYGTVMVPDPFRPGQFLPIHGIVAHSSSEVLATRDATLTRMHQGLNLAEIAPAGEWKCQPPDGLLEAPSFPQSAFSNVTIPTMQTRTSQDSLESFSQAFRIPRHDSTRGSEHFLASTMMQGTQLPSGRENIMPPTLASLRELSNSTSSKALSAKRTDNEDEVQRDVRGRLEQSLAQRAATSGRRRAFD